MTEAHKRVLEKTGWARGKSLDNIPPLVLNKALREIMGDHLVRKASAEFELRLRQQNPDLAAMMQESTLLNSGAIHDLRNALHAMLTLVQDSGGDYADLIINLEYAIFLFETFAEARLKDGWSPFLYDVTGDSDSAVIPMLEQGIRLAQVALPEVTFEKNIALSDHKQLLGDKRQITHGLANLIVAVGSPDAMIRISAGDTALMLVIKAPAITINEWHLHMLIARKIFGRHGGDIHITDNEVHATIPYYDLDTIEEKVDSLTASIQALTPALEKLPPLTEGIDITRLISEPGMALIRRLEQVESLAHEADLERILTKVRYSQLIARNMVMISAGLKPQHYPVALLPIIDELIQILGDYLEDCEVTIQIDPDTPEIVGDKISILQLLVNLITNAVEAMDGEGSLTLAAAAHAKGVEIKVTDTGRGISPERLSQIFDLAHTTKRGQERGVGLHVVSNIIRQLNGTIDVQSVVGMGTTFTVMLPTRPSEVVFTEKPKVLIVEDETIFLESYIKELAVDAALYELDTAKSVKTAQDKYTHIKFDIVIADLKLRTRERGGLEILEEVKSLYPNTQVFILTGYGETDDARESERLGANGYLTKPLESERLRQVIRTAISEWQRVRNSDQAEPDFQPPEPFKHACQVMRDLVNHAAQLAARSENLLIIGEAGTGKGLLAEGIHASSERTHFEFVNCASLSERTLERIFFGTEREGLLARLPGGTLALDRVTGLSLRLQARLFDALNVGFYHHNDTLVHVDNIRVISMDITDLVQAVKQGLFSKDLYRFLARERLVVPPLRERVDDYYRDVLILAEYFIKKYYVHADNEPTLSPQTENILLNYPFPGNVAELEQIIRVALGNLEGETILPEHLPAYILRYGIRATLGGASKFTEMPMLCPHKPVYCNQSEVIFRSHQDKAGVYLRLKVDMNTTLVQTIQQQLERSGLKVLLPDEVRNPLTTMCNVCVPCQSSQYAIVDLSAAGSQILYEVGLLHSLGVVTLLLNQENHSLPDGFKNTQVTTYTDEMEIPTQISNWLAANIVL